MPDPVTAPSALGSLRSAVAVVLGAFLTSRLMLTGVGVLGRVYASQRGDGVGMWAQWDANWYITIIQGGYAHSTVFEGGMMGQANHAFFPLYPLLVMPFAAVMPVKVAGLVVSNLALLGAGFVLHHHVRLRLNADAARMAVLSLFFCPGSFVFSGMMTESVFLLTGLLAFHAAWSGRYGRAGAWGVLVSASRATGVFVGVAMVVNWVKDHVVRAERPLDWRGLLKLSLAPLGLFAFVAYCYLALDDGLAFQHVQWFWHRHASNPVTTVVETLRRGHPDNLHTAVVLGAAVVLLSLRDARVLTLGEYVFLIASVIIPMSSSMDGLTRYLVGMFPLHIALGALMARRPVLGPQLLAAMAMLDAFFMGYWARGHHAFL